MNKKFKIISAVLFSSIVITGCGSINEQHDGNKSSENQSSQSAKKDKMISDKEFEKLPYHDYYSKSDLTINRDTQQYQFKSNDLLDKAELKASTDGTTHKFMKDGSKKLYAINDTLQNVNYDVKDGEPFESPALSIRVTKEKEYNFNELHKNVSTQKNLPFKVTSHPDSRVIIEPNIDAKYDSFSIDNVKGGIIKVSVIAKNKSKHDVIFSDLATMTIDDNEAQPIAGGITIDGVSHGEKDNLLDHFDDKIKPGKDVHATIYYATNHDLSKNRSLLFKFNYGGPLSENNDYYGQVSL